MARQTEGPWYRAGKDTWYVLIDGKNVSLGVKGESNEKQAITAWHRFMSVPSDLRPAQKPRQAPQKAKEASTVSELVAAFLSDAKARLKSNTFEQYEIYLTAFSGVHGKVKAKSMTQREVIAYANRDGWSQAYRCVVLKTIKTAFKWAVGAKIVAVNPVVAMKTPTMPSRGAKASVSPDTHQRLLEASTVAFRLFLTMLHETGARPSELSRLTAQDVDFPSGVAILLEHKTDHTGKPRLIVLTPKAIDILRTQAIIFPEGPLLRNNHGRKWTKDSIVSSMTRTCERAGVKAIAYGYRHAYATDALSKGVPDATVAALLGHSGTATLHKHYAHLTSRMGVLKEAMAKIR